jgi:putative sterol carrier protein
MGENTEENIPKLIHKTDFDTLNKVNAGEINPVQATMDGTYAVDGDMAKLMACSPLIPVTVKAHGVAISSDKNTASEGE